MEDFDLRKYLAEGKLLKEEKTGRLLHDMYYSNFHGTTFREEDLGLHDIDPDSEEDGHEAYIYMEKGTPLTWDDEDEAWYDEEGSDIALEDGDLKLDEDLAEGKLLKEVRGPLKVELSIKKGEDFEMIVRDDYGFDYNVDEEPIEDLFDENGLALRDMSVVYDQRDDMYLMNTEDIEKYH